MRVRNQLFILYIVVLIVIGNFQALGCKSVANPNSSFKKEEIPTVVDEDWKLRLARWLRLSYVEEKGQAGFAILGVSSFEKPDLYTTHSVIGILIDLGRTSHVTEKVDSIAATLESLRDPSGFYYEVINPKKGGIPLIGTDEAISILTRINRNSTAAESTIKYLLALQQPDGLFVFSHDPRLELGRTKGQRIGASVDAIRTLNKLGFREGQPLELTKRGLQDYLAAELSENVRPSSLREPRAGSIILAIQALAILDNTAVPDNAVAFIKKSLQQISFLDGNLMDVVLINNLLDAVDALGLPDGKSGKTVDDLTHFVESRIFPQQLPSGGYSFQGGFIEPNITSHVVRLASRIGATFPNSDRLVEQLSLHSVEGGWSPFKILNLSRHRQNTYYALSLSRMVGFEKHQPALVESYMTKALLGTEGDLTEIYYALLGYKTFHTNLSPDMYDAVVKISSDAVRRLPEGTRDAYSLGIYALIAMEAGFEIPEDLSSQLVETARQSRALILEQAGNHSMAAIYTLWLLQKALPEEMILSSEEVEAMISTLWSESGGFKVHNSAENPNMHSTFVAIQILGDFEVTRREKVKEFVLSLKDRYGFNYEPQIHKEDINAVGQPDIRSTFEALYILKSLE